MLYQRVAVLLTAMSIGLITMSSLIIFVHRYDGEDSHSRRVREIRHRLQRDLVRGNNQFRVAVFGSSQSWGAALPNRFDAYPYLLSPEVDNYALFAAGPNYPAVCTESIVGDDDMYDVIVLEYWLTARDGLPQLAMRLRERFPKAVILFLKLWGPFHGRRIVIAGNPQEERVEQTFSEWKGSLDTPGGDIAHLAAKLRTDEAEWYFPEHNEADAIVADTAKAVNGIVVEIPKSLNAKVAIANHLSWFEAVDNSHLSPVGHTLVASFVKAAISNALAGETAHELANTGVHGNWGRGDRCHLWYTTGAVNVQYSDTLSMKEFNAKLGKFSLEVHGTGWILIDNPFTDYRVLYLSFLMSSPGIYPKTSITVQNNTIMLDPTTDKDSGHANIIQTRPVRPLPPGKSQIIVVSHEQTPEPFRIVGYSFTNEDATPLLTGFGPVFNV